MRRLLLLVVLLLASGCGVSTPLGTKHPATSRTDQPAAGANVEPLPEKFRQNLTEVSAGELIAAYRDNEVAAKAKYGRKSGELFGISLAVTGVILDFGFTREEMPAPFVVIGLVPENSLGRIKCVVALQKDRIAQLKKGQTLTVFGSSAGLHDGEIVLIECALIRVDGALEGWVKDAASSR